MDEQRRYEMIRKMIHPNVTVQSLAMYARRMGKESPEALCVFLEVSSENDISKTAVVAHQPLGDNSQRAQEFVYQILADRCRSPERFTHLDLLAIAVYNDQQLLKKASVFFTEQLLKEAFALADAKITSWLLRASLVHLSEEPCAMVRSAFCTSILINNSRMDSAMAELLPLLLEYDAADVLSVLIEIVGVKKVEDLYGRELFPTVDHLIRCGKDSVTLWEIYFDAFFSQPHTPDELLIDGLWHLEMYASVEIFEEVCAVFYFFVAIHYGVDHPIFDHIRGFLPPAEHSRGHIRRYMDVVDSLWDQPETLSHFLEKTVICNPFSKGKVQKKGYMLFESAHDPVSYHKLTRLFEAHAPASAIINIFFSTDLKLSLPLEDVFYLAQRYEVFSDFLAALHAVPFEGIITKKKPRTLIAAPLSYFSMTLHVLYLTQQRLEKAGREGAEKKGQEIKYMITGFENGHIKTALYEETELTAAKREAVATWADAVEELRSALSLPSVSASQLAITNFSLDSFTEENDLNLLTQLILEHSDRIPEFLDILESCRWNDCFLIENWILKKQVYDNLRRYYEPASRLFEALFSQQKNIGAVLDLYFSSVYKAILPLNKLLFLADQPGLPALLPNYTIYCRLRATDSNLCWPVNILCVSACSVENKEGLFAGEPFAATIADYLIHEGFASRVTLTPYHSDEAGIKKRGEMFGYLAKNIFISERRTKIISTFPGTEYCSYREIVFSMSCTEAALQLRRSDGSALRQLLQVLGEANPFFFQLNRFADRIYLKKFCADHWRKGTVLDMATTMVLNAEHIDCVRDLYLHTSVKYFMRLSDLAQLLCQRRNDLADRLSTMFDGTVFHAIVDSQGMLYMPWVAQNTLRVDQQYAGKVLHCHLKLNRDGTILVTVLQAYQSEAFFDIWDLCRLAGYRSTPEMNVLVDRSALREKLQADTELADEETGSPNGNPLHFDEQVGRLKELLHDPKLPADFFAKQIGKLIRQYHHTTAQQEMEEAVTGITEKWLRLLPGGAVLSPLLFGIYACFMRKYGSYSLGPILSRQCLRFADSKVADAFEKRIKASTAVRIDAPAVTETDAPEEKEAALITEAAPVTEAAAVTGDPSLVEAEIVRIRTMLSAQTKPPYTIMKEIGGVIREYAPFLTAKEMEEAVSGLTEAFMKRYPETGHLRQTLIGLHTCFDHRYHSNSLGQILCWQARTYLDSNTAAFLEARILNQLSRETNTESVPASQQAEEPAHSFSQDLRQLREELRDPQDTSVNPVKGIHKLIRDHHTTVAMRKMLVSVAELTAEYIPQHAFDEQLKQHLMSLHERFIHYYQSVELSLVLCLQVYEYLDYTVGRSLELQIRASKEFRRYAEPEMLLDYFLDNERIPPWKEYCYATS